MDQRSDSCEPMLRESIKHFLAAYRTGCSDFSAFQTIFFRLIQTMPDPPFEVIWFYSAVTFHGAKATPGGDNPPNRMLVMAKDLFQLLISCNDSRNGLKRVALLAPVVSLLYEVVKDSSDNELCLRWEAEDLLHKMVSYVQMSCRDDLRSGNECDVPVACFDELVRVWTIDRVEESCVAEQNLKVFFPIWGGKAWDSFDGGYGIGSLAGIVLCEMFLLRLCLKIRLGIVPEELEKDLQNCAIQTIKTFQNSYFQDTLLKMLLQPTLPIIYLLSSEDGVSLMRVLYDVLLLVDCSFLNTGRWIQLLDNQSRNLALMWSLVADTAVQLARDSGDHIRALSYANSFCKSQLSNQLIKWLSAEAGIEEKCRPSIGNPEDLIRWISILEGQGRGVIDKSVSKLLPKAVVASKPGLYSTLPSSICSYSSKSFDEEMVDPGHDRDPATMPTMERSNDDRKRKEGMRDANEARIKLVRHSLHDNTRYANKFGSGVEMGNSVFDEDMEVAVSG